MVEVTQADRELLIELISFDSETIDAILAGNAFTWEVEQIARHRIAALEEARGDQVARLIAHMKTIEPDEETAGCPATWADFIQILEGIAEAGEPFNG